MKFDFTSKTAIVTGALGAIGSAIAGRFLESGANVVLSDIVPEAGDALAPYALYEDRVRYIPCDVSNKEQAEALCKQTVECFGAIDFLINNAGINSGDGDRKPLGEYRDALWDKILSIDLNGVYHCSKPALEDMLRHGGVIVNIGSVMGYVPCRLQSAFAAAKAGVHNLTRAMAIEYADKKVRVNAVLPGSVISEQTRAMFYSKPEKCESLLSHIPMHRPGTPEEIASAVLFLCDEDASYITGELLIVDGGWTCGYSRDW